MDDFPTPRNLKQLRSFLGLASYYRRFIPKFSQVAAPLYVMTKKDALYQWTPKCQDTFDELKQKLTQAPLLAFPDFSKSFILETDASESGLGEVLAQEQDDGMVKPICYASRTQQTHEKNHGVSELEALAVVWAVKHFRVYLYGHKCKVYTDHEALMKKPRYAVIDNVLYHLSEDKSLHTVVPQAERHFVFKEVHQGRFAGHLCDAKIHSQLSKTYWWPHMRRDITSWCRTCEVCASRHVVTPIKPHLTPIPIGGAFDRVGVISSSFLKAGVGNSMQLSLWTT